MTGVNLDVSCCIVVVVVVGVEEEEEEVESEEDADVRTSLLLLLFRREFKRFMWAELLVDFLMRCVGEVVVVVELVEVGSLEDGLITGSDGDDADECNWDGLRLLKSSLIDLLARLEVVLILLELAFSTFDLVIRDVNEEISNKLVVKLVVEVVDVDADVDDALLDWLTLEVELRVENYFKRLD